MALAINPDFHRDRCTIDSRQIAAAPFFESHYTSCSLEVIRGLFITEWFFSALRVSSSVEIRII